MKLFILVLSMIHFMDEQPNSCFVVAGSIAGDYPEESVYYDSEGNRLSWDTGLKRGDIILYWSDK